MDENNEIAIVDTLSSIYTMLEQMHRTMMQMAEVQEKLLRETQLVSMNTADLPVLETGLAPVRRAR